MAEEEVPSLAGMSAEELRELMRDLLPKLDLPILDVATLEEGAAYTCRGGQVLASTATVTPEALQPLAMAEGKAICVSTGGFTDDARAYGSEFGVELYEAQDLARMVSEHGVWERELRPEETGLRFLPSIGTLEAIMNEASRAFAAGNYGEAASHYRQAVALKPHYDFAWALLGVCHQRVEEYDEAMACFQKALEISVDNPDVWFFLGSLLYALDRHEEELEAYDQAIRLRPGFVEALTNKGATLHELGRYEDALECYEAALEAGAKDAGTLANRGAALMRLDRYEEALEALEAAVEANPRDVDARHNLGMVLQHLGRHEEALENFRAVVKRRPGSPALWVAKGESHLELREKDAESCFRKALEIDPDFAPAKDGLKRAKKVPLKDRPPEPKVDHLAEAREALSAGDLEAAAAAYEGATEARPKDAEAWYERGMTLALSQDLEGSLEAFTRAIELRENDLRYRLSRMNVLTELGRYEEALEDSNAALKAGAKGLEIWLRRGELFRQLEMPREAAQCFKEALEMDDTLPSVWNARGQALADAGDAVRARKSLERALTLNPDLAEAKERLEALAEMDEGDALEFLLTVPGLGKDKAKALIDAGFRTVKSLEAASEDGLCSVQGIGPATAKRILAHLEEARGSSGASEVSD